MYKAVIFDMDGTILNTLDDLTVSLNYALGKLGHRNDYDAHMVGMFFGSGVRVAFERAFAYEKGCDFKELEQIGTEEYDGAYKVSKEQSEEIDKLLEIYLPHYSEHCNDNTRAYDGIGEVITKIRQMGLKTAVVSNKPDAAVKILCEEVFAGLFDYNLGELPSLKRKPARDMVDNCLENLGVTKEESVYVGDSEVDLLTAENSQMPCIAVTWGFRGREFLENHGAEIIIDKPEDIIKEL